MRVPKILTAGLLAIVLLAAFSTTATASTSFGFFYSNLSPYGSWVVSSSYGQVWRPSVYSVGWNPYYDGHWVYTDLGWTWVSDYPWGDVCYHYGTWDFEPALGWVWVPGYVWAPSWVVFRTGPDYIGWAPVPPRFSIGASFNVGGLDESRFVFVSAGNFLAPSIRFHTVPVAQTRLVFRHTNLVNNLRIENNIVVNRGLDVRDLERVSGRHVRMVPIERVQHVAPGPRFTRNDVRIDPERMHRGVRAAEPAPARPSGPPERRRDDREKNRNGKGRTAEQGDSGHRRAPDHGNDRASGRSGAGRPSTPPARSGSGSERASNPTGAGGSMMHRHAPADRTRQARVVDHRRVEPRSTHSSSAPAPARDLRGQPGSLRHESLTSQSSRSGDAHRLQPGKTPPKRPTKGAKNPRNSG